MNGLPRISHRDVLEDRDLSGFRIHGHLGGPGSYLPETHRAAQSPFKDFGARGADANDLSGRDAEVLGNQIGKPQTSVAGEDLPIADGYLLRATCPKSAGNGNELCPRLARGFLYGCPHEDGCATGAGALIIGCMRSTDGALKDDSLQWDTQLLCDYLAEHGV